VVEPAGEESLFSSSPEASDVETAPLPTRRRAGPRGAPKVLDVESGSETEETKASSLYETCKLTVEDLSAEKLEEFRLADMKPFDSKVFDPSRVGSGIHPRGRRSSVLGVGTNVSR